MSYLFEKRRVARLVREFPPICGRLVMGFTKTATESYPESVESTVQTITPYVFDIHLILSSHLRLGLPICLSFSSFVKFYVQFLSLSLSPTSDKFSAQITLLDFRTECISYELRNFRRYPVTSSLFEVRIFPLTVSRHYPQSVFSLSARDQV